MYDDSYDNDGTDFWKGYDSSAAASPVLGSKATFSHIEYSPSTSYSFKPVEPPADIHPSTVPELVFTHHRTTSTTDTPESHPQPLSAVETSEEDDDTSYWSQYSKVQGSGDSTVPSPRLPNGKKPELDEFGRPLLEVGEDDHTPAAVEVIEYQPTASLRGDPYLRGSVGVEEEFADAPFGRGFDDAFAAKEDEKAPEVSVIGGGLGLTTHHVEQPEEAPLASEASDSGSSESAGSTALTSEAALEEAMRGIYWLWKGQDANRTVEQFLGLVKRAVEP